MASIPSASALSAVLRCKRPPASAYRLGLTYGALQPPSRVEEADRPERRNSLWAFNWLETRVSSPGVSYVVVRLESVRQELKKRNSQVKRLPTPRNSGPRPEASQVQESRVSEVDLHSLHPHLDSHRVNGGLRETGSPSLKLTLLSEPGKVVCVCVGCKRDRDSLSVLTDALLQFTASFSQLVLHKLGVVWKRGPLKVSKFLYIYY